MSKNFYINILILFGVGNIKYAPGTIASFVTCLFYCYLFSEKAGIFLILLFYVFLTILSINLIDKFSNNFKKKDSKEIVIDEFIGQSLPLLFFYILIPFHDKDFFYFLTLISFLLFRLFDIFKPYPISLVDKKMKNGLGVVLDDILAGLFSTIIIILFLWLTSIL